MLPPVDRRALEPSANSQADFLEVFDDVDEDAAAFVVEELALLSLLDALLSDVEELLSELLELPASLFASDFASGSAEVAASGPEAVPDVRLLDA